MKKPLLISVLLSVSTTMAAPQANQTQNTYFQDVTLTSKVNPKNATTSVAFGDFNNDGLPDMLIEKKLFKNISTNEQIQFEDVTETMGLAQMDGYPLFADINNDGTQDILTTKGQIFIQRDGKYVDEAASFGLLPPKEIMTLSVGDYNRDGWPDIVYGISEYYDNVNFNHFPPKLYKNIGGKRFVDASEELHFNQYKGYTRGITWADFNNDSYVDLYLSNYRLLPNFMFQNKNGTFQETSDVLGIKGEYNPKKFYDAPTRQNFGPQYGHTIGSTWADYNNDGFLDLWVSNLVHKYVGPSGGGYDIRGYVCDDSKIYKNVNGLGFQDVRPNSMVAYKPIGDQTKYIGDELWSHATAADFDNDGLTDTYVSQVYNFAYAHSLLFKNIGAFKFQDVSGIDNVRVIDSYAAAFADLNNDGKQDLVISGRPAVGADPVIRIFKNVNKKPNEFMKFKLLGMSSGKHPAGAQVRIKTSKGTMVRQFEGNTGTLNQQNDPVLHFGLGQGLQIFDIEVVWPSGVRQKLNLQSTYRNSLNTVIEAR